MSFSNKEMQIGGARGPKPGHGRPPGIVIGKKRKKLLLHAAVMSEAINIGEPEFEGDSLSVLPEPCGDHAPSARANPAAACQPSSAADTLAATRCHRSFAWKTPAISFIRTSHRW